MNELPVGISRLSQIVFKKKHYEGPMVKSCNGKQYKMLLFRSWTLRTKSKSDCYVILHDQRVVRVYNIVENEEGLFLIGHCLVTEHQLSKHRERKQQAKAQSSDSNSSLSEIEVEDTSNRKQRSRVLQMSSKTSGAKTIFFAQKQLFHIFFA
jgi:hypothetical protein